MNFYLINGLVIDPSQNILKKVNLEVRNGKIFRFFQGKPDIKSSKNKIYDVKNYIVSPGFVDIHVHLRDPGLTHKESIKTGSMAAAAGGFTSIACMPNTSPPNDEPKITKYILDKAKKDSKINIFPIGAITKKQKDKELARILDNITAGCVGISDDGFPVSNSRLLYEAMLIAKAEKVPVISHCEDCFLSGDGVMTEGHYSKKFKVPGISNLSEELGIIHDLAIAEKTGCHLHVCHVSTKGSVELIRQAKRKGINVTCEVAPHHFTLCDRDVDIKNSNYKMNPPLRSKRDLNSIINGISDGTIDIIATDHAPHTDNEKSVGFKKAPFGIIGLETALPLSLNLVRKNKIDLMSLINMLSTKPSKIINVKKGTLKKGSAADITVFDPNRYFTFKKDNILSKSFNSPFLDKRFKGKVLYTFTAGNKIYSLDN
ncbi:dihydroorotase [bacterium]|nr:dihydroorotase [bacterium]